MGPPTPYIARRQCVSFLHNTVMLYANMYLECFICIFATNTSSSNNIAQVALKSFRLYFVLVFMNEIILLLPRQTALLCGDESIRTTLMPYSLQVLQRRHLLYGSSEGFDGLGVIQHVFVKPIHLE